MFRSIEFQSPAHTVWPQYYMLGEILRTYGDIQGSLHYYRLALELNPTHELIVKALRDIDNKPTAGIHTYTVVIIITLVNIILSHSRVPYYPTWFVGDCCAKCNCDVLCFR